MPYFYIEFSQAKNEESDKKLFKINAYAEPQKIIKRNFSTTYIPETGFQSYVLSDKLAESDVIYPYIAVLEDVEAVDEMKIKALRFAEKELIKLLCERYKQNKMQKINPGVIHDWDIAELKKFDKLFSNTYDILKVSFDEETFRYKPDYTSVGIIFPTQKEFSNCDHCKMENCPSSEKK